MAKIYQDMAGFADEVVLMFLQRLLDLSRVSKVSRRPALASLKAEWLAEIEAIEKTRSEIQAELRALEQAALTFRPGLIPDSLRWPRNRVEAGISVPPTAIDPGDGNLDPNQVAAQVALAALETRRDLLLVLSAQVQEERLLMHQLLMSFHPGMAWMEAGEHVRQLCQKPMELSGFYLARADWDSGWIHVHFPVFFEAGRSRSLEGMPLERTSGLTGWALFEDVPRYLDSLQACEAHGMSLTEAELSSGLFTKSWFGVPLRSSDTGSPIGLMAFHCYQAGAFSPDRRRLMTMVARTTALHLRDHSAPSYGG
jgi:hypothetical protein